MADNFKACQGIPFETLDTVAGREDDIERIEL